VSSLVPLFLFLGILSFLFVSINASLFLLPRINVSSEGFPVGNVGAELKLVFAGYCGSVCGETGVVAGEVGTVCVAGTEVGGVSGDVVGAVVGAVVCANVIPETSISAATVIDAKFFIFNPVWLISKLIMTIR
jgi:hypothetical protein